jgi:hypothetical protein
MPPAENGAVLSELAALRVARWEQEQELDSLRETIVIFRQGATALASQITELQLELAGARTPTTRKRVCAAQQEVELTLAGDADAPAVTALLVGESLADDHTDNMVEACQAIAAELMSHCVLRADSEQMLSLRIRHSENAIGIEIVPE